MKELNKNMKHITRYKENKWKNRNNNSNLLSIFFIIYSNNLLLKCSEAEQSTGSVVPLFFEIQCQAYPPAGVKNDSTWCAILMTVTLSFFLLFTSFYNGMIHGFTPWQPSFHFFLFLSLLLLRTTSSTCVLHFPFVFIMHGLHMMSMSFPHVFPIYLCI